MEPSTDSPLLPPPGDPIVERVTGDVGGIMDRAYLEMIARTQPVAFLKFATALLGMRVPRSHDRQQTVVNVVNAIPRSPLDQLPASFLVDRE